MQACSLNSSSSAAEQPDFSPVDTLPALRGREIRPARFSSKVVEQALGLHGRRLVAFLLDYRATGRKLHMLVATLAEKVGTDERTCRKLLALLRRMGLERYHGRQVEMVPSSQVLSGHKVTALVRTLVPVRSVIADLNSLGQVVATPLAIQVSEEVVAQRRNHGGRRAGAGRPKGSKNVPKESSLSAEGLLLSKDLLREAKKPLSSGPLAASEDPILETINGTLVGHVVPATDSRSERSRLQILGQRYLPPDIRLTDDPDPTGVHGASSPIWKRDHLIRVRSPAPPSIDPNAEDVDKAAMVMAAYRGMVEHVWPKLGRCAVLSRPAHLRNSKFYPKILNLARLCQEHSVSPISWMLFQADGWRAVSKVDGPPALPFVLSEARFLEQLEWFEEVKDEYMGRRAMICDELRLLYADHMAMWTALIKEKPATRPGLCAVVDRFFPIDGPCSWEARFERARVGQLVLRDDMWSAVRKGAMIW